MTISRLVPSRSIVEDLLLIRLSGCHGMAWTVERRWVGELNVVTSVVAPAVRRERMSSTATGTTTSLDRSQSSEAALLYATAAGSIHTRRAWRSRTQLSSQRYPTNQPAAVSHSRCCLSRPSTIFSTPPPRRRDLVTSHVLIRIFQSLGSSPK